MPTMSFYDRRSRVCCLLQASAGDHADEASREANISTIRQSIAHLNTAKGALVPGCPGGTEDDPAFVVDRKIVAAIVHQVQSPQRATFRAVQGDLTVRCDVLVHWTVNPVLLHPSSSAFGHRELLALQALSTAAALFMQSRELMEMVAETRQEAELDSHIALLGIAMEDFGHGSNDLLPPLQLAQAFSNRFVLTCSQGIAILSALPVPDATQLRPSELLSQGSGAQQIHADVEDGATRAIERRWRLFHKHRCLQLQRERVSIVHSLFAHLVDIKHCSSLMKVRRAQPCHDGGHCLPRAKALKGTMQAM